MINRPQLKITVKIPTTAGHSRGHNCGSYNSTARPAQQHDAVL
jgi:hypothetical protein